MVFTTAKLILKPGIATKREIKLHLYGTSVTYKPDHDHVGLTEDIHHKVFEEKLITFVIVPKIEETSIRLKQLKIPGVRPDIKVTLDDLIQIEGSFGSIVIDIPSDKIQYGNRLELDYHFYGIDS
jgi:hypothetical protein